ncbi:DUF6090 family protein [Fulvivirga sedimenti]|uniref:Uncharacterized protein n=1 Tax=Fulvivirga sedimenti TaxID=2879465 RepID=A0A9X1HN44_9BACT|nr:DUF6090 family protein [Fulvivirga sedimenti]MCA6074050.1 hypothetical protein [Fulvivirga sedimenti]
MDKKSTGQYIKYAVGEILLVVIGILIALQINNWNESRKETLALQTLTENLKNEFLNNLKQLEIDKARLTVKISAASNILKFTGGIPGSAENLQMDSLLFYAIDNPTWNPSSYVLNDIKNAGKLSALKNEELKLLLYKWERLYEDMLEWHILLEGTGRTLMEVLYESGSTVNIDHFKARHTSKFSVDNLELLQNLQFENVLEDNLYAARQLDEKYGEAMNLLNEIIEASGK